MNESMLHPTGGRNNPSTLAALEVEESRILRKRRMLRADKKDEEKELHYHMFGSITNLSLLIIAMLFIITISATGGLCFKDGEFTVFSFQQKEKCNACTDYTTNCQMCDLPGGGNQCYFPYYKT